MLVGRRPEESSSARHARPLGSPAMETINACIVVPPSQAPEPVHFGPAETQDAYAVMVGTFPPGQPAPPLHLHPHTDEAFYVADGDATFLLGDREVHVTAGRGIERCAHRQHPIATEGVSPASAPACNTRVI